MATDFRALLQYTSENVPRPKGIPECFMTGKIGNHHFDNVRSEKQTPYCRFELLDVQPHPETEEETLAVITSLDPPLTERSLSFDAFMTAAAMSKFTDMLDRVVGHPNLSMEVRVPQTQGQRVMFKVTPQVDREGKETGFSRVDVTTVTATTTGS